MSNPIHASHYADQASQWTLPIVENVCIARDTWRVRLEAPQLAEKILPGQFVMLRLADYQDPLIGRALALYQVVDQHGKPHFVDLVYIVKGKFTTALHQCSGGNPVTNLGAAREWVFSTGDRSSDNGRWRDWTDTFSDAG